jgi:hypothetical protein
VPFTNGITFSDNGAGRVAWTTGTLTYKGTNYTISAEATGDTNQFIYWDLNSANTTFKTSNTLADALGADKWAMCYNATGTPYPSSAYKILHGGYIEASTIDTVHLNALSITTAKINNLDVTNDKLATNAVSNPKILDDSTAYYETASITGNHYFSGTGWETINSDIIVSGGGFIQVGGSGTFRDTAVPRTTTIELRLLHGSTVVGLTSYSFTSSLSYNIVRLSVVGLVAPGSGSQTFTLQAKTSVSANMRVYNRQMMLNESRGK